MVIQTNGRPKCQTCGIRLVPVTWAKSGEKWYYRSECGHCARVRRGTPIMGDTSTHIKLMAKRLGLDVTACMRCGWKGYCHTHHQDRNGGHNSKGNIEILCPNCHMDEHHGKPKDISLSG